MPRLHSLAGVGTNSGSGLRNSHACVSCTSHSASSAWGKQGLQIVCEHIRDLRGSCPPQGRILGEGLRGRGKCSQASAGPGANAAPVESCSVCRLSSHSFLRAVQECQRLSSEDLSQMPCHSPGMSPKVTAMCHILYTPD